MGRVFNWVLIAFVLYLLANNSLPKYYNIILGK